MKASVGPKAHRELADGALFYAREGGLDVGRAFIAEFERTLNLLTVHPELGASWSRGRRRFPVRKFPYSIVYDIRGEELIVVALAHHRRKPGFWSSR